MVKSFITHSMTQKTYVLASLFAIAIMGYYVWNNWGYGAEGFYLFGFAKFLVFGCLYDFLLFLRIKMYTQMENFGIIRTGRDNWYRQIMKIEALLLQLFLLTVFVVLPILNGIENKTAYLVGLVPLLLVWEIGYFAEMWFLPDAGKELYGLWIAFLLFVVYTYVLGPALFTRVLG